MTGRDPFARWLGDGYAPEVRRHVGFLTVVRLATNTCYRFTPPFVAIIARGFDISLTTIGLVLTVSEMSGFLGPVVGRLADRLPRRRAMTVGLAGCGAGAWIAAASPSPVALCAGITLISIAKMLFDLGMAGWMIDHVPYERRGRVVGITETSWAIALLVGVSSLGLVVAAGSWRGGYALAGVAVVIGAVAVRARMSHEPRPTRREDAGRGWPHGHAWAVPVAMFGLMCASQCGFLTFGAWLEDRHGIGAAGIAAVGFGLGIVELGASTWSARRTDAWGKETSVALGAVLMVPAGLVLAVMHDSLLVGLVALGAFFLGFEFAVVSLLPVAAQLVPGREGSGLGIVMAGATLGRGVMSIGATWLYDAYGGLTWPAVAGAAWAALATAAILGFHRRGGASRLLGAGAQPR